jgi:glycosyltransferase involved in cell wall biosynthesis
VTADESNGRRARPTICQLLHGLQVGGAEVLAVRLARELGSAYQFLFVCLDELGSLGEELRREGAEVLTLKRRPGVDWRCAYRLATLLRQHRVDVIQAHQYTPFFYALMARLLYRHPAVLFTEHGRHHPDYPRRKRMFVNRLLLKRRDRVVGVGEAVRQALIQNEGIPQQRVELIYNGIDLSPFSSDGHDRRIIRQEMGVGANDFVILQVARLDYLKDHATAIRTLARVVSQCKNARLILVGEGPQRELIEGMIGEHKLAAQVRLLGLRRDVARLLSAADLFLLTSISEGIPLTVIEAMAAGLPVVSTNVGGVAEIIKEEQTGLLAAAGDDASLAEKVLRLAKDAALGRAMGERGRERARSLFSESQMHARYRRLFTEMMDGPR